jgi:hypothetical protein
VKKGSDRKMRREEKERAMKNIEKNCNMMRI